MSEPGYLAWPRRQVRFWATPVLICLVWLPLLLFAAARQDRSAAAWLGWLSALPVFCTALIWSWRQGMVAPATSAPPLSGAGLKKLEAIGPDLSPVPSPSEVMTRSGLYDSPAGDDSSVDDGMDSGRFAITDMVNRLDPVSFRWIDSSLAEQEFLGWSSPELERKSFLDIVHPDDRQRALDALRQTLVKGEFLGLVVRVRTMQGQTKAVEVNAGARYASGNRVTYLRCHLADVTEKIRADRELRLRSRELTQLNEQLRQINRELEELKDRYSDLYENAPAMYFSLDGQGRVIECNQTMLASLNRNRQDTIGRHFEQFLEPGEVEHCRGMFKQLLETGSLETASRWVCVGGGQIDVWISGKVVRGLRDGTDHTRCVAQDVTTKHRLEAELRAMNDSLGFANAELSRKNLELDEFVYVVSHDLQEPLRTLSVFSDFLLQDHAHKIDAEGKQYVQHLVDASRRMRSMIQGLLTLSRAGRVTDEFVAASLHELVDIVKADLRALILGRGAEIRLDGPDVSLWGDRRRLQQLFSNLFSNALKYNQSEVPRIVVGVSDPDTESTPNPHLVTIYVRDNGIGIEPRHHKKVFQLFRRLHSQDEYDGIGVGLAICEKIVHAHCGQIRVDSELGHGATFFVRLPRPPAMGPGVDSHGAMQISDGVEEPRIPVSEG